MKIWLMQTGEQLPIRSGVRKMRIAVLADKLLERGHKVLWWASAFEHQQKIMVSKKDRNFDISERYTIRVLRGCSYRKNVSMARYVDHQIVALKFWLQSKKFPKPDAIMASMPDHLLAYEAVRYAKRNSVPVLVDIRDLWPDIFLDRFKKMGMTGLGKMVLARDFKLLVSLLNKADALTAVSKGYLQWGLDKIGRSESLFDKVFYLGYKNSNARNPVNEDESLGVSDWLKGREDQKVFVFIGTFGVSYELELILDAAKRFSRSGRTDICFVLAGTGEKSGIVSKKAAGLQNVVLPGWIGEKEINALLKIGHAGLLSYIKDAPQGLPNKPFEYLSAGLPLVNSLEGEMAELIDQHGFGLNYLPGDLEGLCGCIERLASDPGMHDEMSRKALEFFKEYGDADKIYDEYATHIEKIVEHRKKISPKRTIVDKDYVSVTEIAGDKVTQEQIDRLCNRYYWASRYFADKDVVEVACGSGQGLGYLSGIARSLEAGDYSDAILDIARQHYGERIALRQFDAQDMSFEDKSKDVIIMFEAIYYIPDAEKFVGECARVLRPEGKVLIATANKDLYDFNPSPHSYKYYGVVELNELFSKHGFETEFFGDMPVGEVSMRQRVLRPIKKLAVMLGIMPKTTAGKKWLKRIVFGGLVEMPAEIGPQITQIDADLRAKKGPRITRIARNEQKKENTNDLYRGRYVEPDRISSEEANMSHKVIYCVATLD